MLGVSHFILPLLDIDIKPVRTEDVHYFLGNQVYQVAVENIEHEVLVQPKLHQAHSFKNQLETLEILDKDLNLKPFQEILEHFVIPEANPANSKVNPYSCELCSTEVKPEN